jgi:hypothetical protein
MIVIKVDGLKMVLLRGVALLVQENWKLALQGYWCTQKGSIVSGRG